MIETTLKWITPEYASELLKNNKNNRKVKTETVRKYASIMKAGKWSLTHQGIALYKNGEIADGQHRLLAIVSAGVAVQMLFTTGVEIEDGALIDELAPRSMSDAIKIGQLADWIGKDEVAVIRQMGKLPRKPHIYEIVEFGEAHKKPIQFALCHFVTKAKGITTAPMIAAIATAYYYESENDLKEFCTAIKTGFVDDERKIAALKLRDFLITNGKSYSQSFDGKVDSYLRTQRAIKAFCERQKISKLYAPTSAIYKLPELHK